MNNSIKNDTMTKIHKGKIMMQEDSEKELRQLAKETNFANKNSTYLFYNGLKKLLEKEKSEDIFFNVKITYGSIYRNPEEIDLFSLLVRENNSKKNVYLCQLLSECNDYNLSGSDIFYGVFLPFMKSKATKNGVPKKDLPFYAALLNKENVMLMFEDQSVFKGLSALNKLLRVILKINDLTCVESGWSKELWMKVLKKMLSSKGKSLLRTDAAYYSDNLFKILKTYPELGDIDTKSGNKKMKFLEKIMCESPKMTYDFLCINLPTEKDKFLNFYVNEVVSKLSRSVRPHNITSLESLNKTLVIDFDLIEKVEGWEKKTLKNGQDLLSIYCAKKGLTRHKLLKLIDKEGFGEFLEKRKENFIVDLCKTGEISEEYIKIVSEKYEFLKEKPSVDIILDAVMRRAALKRHGHCFSDINNKQVSMLNHDALPMHLIFGTLEQQTSLYRDDEALFSLYVSGGLNEGGKEIKEELYRYNESQPDSKKRKEYADFIFYCNNMMKEMSKDYRYNTVWEKLNALRDEVLNIKVPSDYLKKLCILKKMMDYDVNYKKVLDAALEQKKILESIDLNKKDEESQPVRKRI